MAKKPLIYVGIPCYRGVSPEVYEDHMRFMYHLGRRMTDYDFASGVLPKTEQFRARNSIVESAMSAGADWLLMLDDDMIINPLVTVGPSNAYDFLARLLAHDKDIIGALYYQRIGGCMPVAMMASSEDAYRFLRDDELTGGLQKVDVTGGGAMLVRMSVFDKIPHPYFAPEHKFGTDVQLCRAAATKGIETYLDSSIEIGHQREERVTITSRNKMQYAIENSVSGEVKQQMVQSNTFNLLMEDAAEYTGLKDIMEMSREGQRFMTKENRDKHLAMGGTVATWYLQYPKERVARQVWFNTANHNKRMMTEAILQTVGDSISADILDFGCGIGIPAFEFARRGHRVTACDIEGTGTIEFLKWRIRKYGLPMTLHYTRGGVPALGGATFGAIIAMDCLEHIPEWRMVLRELAARLQPGGLLFCNNGILDDTTHPEHVGCSPKEFAAECAGLGLVPFGPVSFQKPVKKTLSA